MNGWEVVGYSQFTTKKGTVLFNVFCVYDDPRTIGKKVESFICGPDVVHDGPIQVGSIVDVSWTRNGYCRSVTVIG